MCVNKNFWVLAPPLPLPGGRQLSNPPLPASAVGNATQGLSHSSRTRLKGLGGIRRLNQLFQYEATSETRGVGSGGVEWWDPLVPGPVPEETVPDKEMRPGCSFWNRRDDTGLG